MESKNVTRSQMLARLGMAPIAIGAFAALVAEADAGDDNKKQFGYQNKPKGAAKCSGCALFVAPNKCNVVHGVISPNGWCKAYAKK